MTKIHILGTGLSGLVGSRVTELLEDSFEFADLSFTTGVDITKAEQIEEIFRDSPARAVLHMAAKTDVDACEEDKIYTEEGAAWLVNVLGTQNIVSAAQKYNKRVIYISTDFVFDGTKDYYREDDPVNPVNWYGYTKCEGERIIRESGISHAIARLAYPYRTYFGDKLDFVRKIIDIAGKKGEISALTDHIFTPTFIDDIAYGLNILLQKELEGIYHLVGNQSLTPFEAAEKILNVFHLKGKVIGAKREEYFRNRAFRPFKLVLKNDKISKLGLEMKTFDEGLQEIKLQLGK